jgi:hypothetical protein
MVVEKVGSTMEGIKEIMVSPMKKLSKAVLEKSYHQLFLQLCRVLVERN